MQYEILYLIDQNNEARSQEIETSIEEVIIKHGGKMLQDRWEDKRKLAYPVKHVIKGIYVARRFDLEQQDPWAEEEAPAPALSNITQELNLSSDVLRFVIVKSEGMLSLNEFVLRKNEELKQRKNPKQAKQERVIEKPKRRKPQEKSSTPLTPEKPKSSKTGSKEEIDEKLDEILNI